jgi:hypothetical protein
MCTCAGNASRSGYFSVQTLLPAPSAKKNRLTSDRIQNHGDCLYAQVCYLQKVSLVPTKDVCSYFHTTVRFAQLHGHHDFKVLHISINRKGIKVAEYLQKKLKSNNACG